MQKIRIDFDNPGLPQHISAVENDSQSRFFQATLYENGKAYTAPEGTTYSIMYRGFGPQNQGWYDTINDGAGKRAACAVSGNVVTCEIARQALQVPGHVSIVLCVTTGKGYMLKSWPIECDCKNDRYDSTAEIQSFFYITQVSNADWTQAIQAWENLKDAIDPTLSLSGKAADAKATGDAVGQLKKDIIYIENATTTKKFLKKSYVDELPILADPGRYGVKNFFSVNANDYGIIYVKHNSNGSKLVTVEISKIIDGNEILQESFNVLVESGKEREIPIKFKSNGDISLSVKCETANIYFSRYPDNTSRKKYNNYYTYVYRVDNGVFSWSSEDGTYDYLSLPVAFYKLENNLLEEVNNIKNSLTPRYATKYTTQEQELYKKISEAATDDSIIFSLISDIHATNLSVDYDTSETKYGNVGNTNYINHAEVFNRISEIAGVDFKVCLGDSINATTDEANDLNKGETLRRLQQLMNVLGNSFKPLIYAMAHHELYPFKNWANSLSISQATKLTQYFNTYVHKIYDKQAEHVSSPYYDSQYSYFCVDYETQNIRLIILNSADNLNSDSNNPNGFSQKQINWLKDTLTDTSKNVVFFSHAPVIKEANWSGDLYNGDIYNGDLIENEIKTFITNGGKVLAFFHGHTHMDNIGYSTDKTLNFPFISIASSLPESPTMTDLPTIGNPKTWDRKYGTYSEYCFDVVVMNKTSIKMYRFGAGEDRSVELQ